MGGDTAAHSLGDQSTFGDANVDDVGSSLRCLNSVAEEKRFAGSSSRPCINKSRILTGMSRSRMRAKQRSRMTTELIQLTNNAEADAAADAVPRDEPNAESGTSVTRVVAPRPTH